MYPYLYTEDNSNANPNRQGPYGSLGVDTTAPTVIANNSSPTVWKTSDITITLGASDNFLPVTAKYSRDNSDCWNGGTAYTSGTQITKTTSSSQILYLCATDQAGNTGIRNGTYKLDKTMPTNPASLSCTIGGSNANQLYINYTNPTVACTWPAGSDTPSGISGYQILLEQVSPYAQPYLISVGNVTNYNLVTSSLLNTDYNYRVRSIDIAGNIPG
jgi:hypothetical protein